MKILLIGSGGREHALAWKIAQSPLCTKLYCAPGNPGIADHAECIDIAVDQIQALTEFAQQNGINLVVVGPEGPLVAGLGSAFEEIGIPVFGPSQTAAQLEGSKAFTKTLCDRYDIPTAAYGRFTEIEKAAAFLREKGTRVVIKADGLAAGKGVVIPETLEEAIAAAEDMLAGASFGDAGAEIVIEEFLDGEELSFFALCDGQRAVPFTSAQDHKRVGDGDTGPNTGGMGAYSPAHLMTPDLHAKIMDRIIHPSVRGMADQGMPFKGILFAGIMVVDGDPYLIEYNVRFGDPECQVMLPRLKTDLVEILLASAKGDLSKFVEGFEWSENAALGVVMAASGYPGQYKRGGVIANLDAAEKQANAKIFHAGTALKDGSLVANGGRVLTVMVEGATLKQAQQKAYEAVSIIDWQDGFCRKDIGWRAIAAAKDKAA